MAGVPVLVVHGVANRDQKAFEDQVAKIQDAVGQNYQLIPVWWADLGGKTDHIGDTLPDMDARTVRSESNEQDLAALGASIASQPTEYLVRSEEAREEIIVQAAQTQVGTDTEVRAGDELEEAIHDGWKAATYLPLIQDSRALEAIGRAVAIASGSTPPPQESASTFVTRGAEEAAEIDTRSFKVQVANVARTVMGEIDKIVGYAVGQVVGDMNQSLRATWAAPIGLFLGDILAYQRKQPEIQERLFQAIVNRASGWGTKEKPIAVAAHSLGGVIAFDAATRTANPLWISNLITFGSQASFFEVLDPRASLPTYAPGSPIVLPASIQRWTSLWEPLDVLAFAAGKVFRLPSGVLPTDIRTVHDLNYGMNTHGSYWHCSELVQAICQIPILQ